LQSAVWDAGYSGRGEGLLSVLNPRGYRLQRGAAVLQLVFLRLSTATAEGYTGKYQGEGQPGPAGGSTGPAGSMK
jgi:dUTP pyrophosphatase